MNPRSAPPSGGEKPTKRSVLGFLFKPQLGSTLSPLRESMRIFVQLVAIVFAVFKLIPKDYPGLRDAEAHISFFNVIRTAWQNVRFTREGAPRAILFFVVVGVMAFSAFVTISMLLSLFVGQAHADTSMFTSPNPDSDLASNWITFLFDSQNSGAALSKIQSTLVAAGATGLVMPSTTIQSALTAALALYSNAILVIAAIILFYHLAAMVVETAHHGVPMGKEANQIWAPIRLVVAIGLLVPINGGLNCGQYIVIKLAQMGSGLASNIWGTFVTQLATDSGKNMPTLAPPSSGMGLAPNLVMMYACEYSFNAQISFPEKALGTVTFSSDEINGWPWSQGGTPAGPNGALNPTATQKFSFTNATLGDYDLCGSYTIPAKPVMSDPALQTVSDSIYNATIAAFMTANPLAAAVGAKIDPFMPPNPPIFTPSTGPKPTHQDVQNVADTLQAALNAAVSNASVGSALSGAVSTLQTNSTKEGWISAGAWFNKLSSFQAEVNGVASMSLPQTSPPTIDTRADESAMEDVGFFAHARDFLTGYIFPGGAITGAANVVGQNVLREKSHSHYTQTVKDLNSFASAIGASPPAQSKISTQTATCAPTDPMLCILSVVDSIAISHGVWNNPAAGNGNALGVVFAGQDPLMEIAAFGHKTIQAALDFFNIGIGVAAGSALLSSLSIIPGIGTAIGGVLGSLGLAAAGMIFFIGTLFFTMGMVVAYFIPLLPFMHFFFNTITWIACVAESIIAIPMVALAHLTPKGDGLPGQAAKGAYYMIFSVFLRPVMMVFGLICSLLIMYVAVGLLNALYAYAVAGASLGTPTGSHAAISRLMYTAIYVVILYSIANHAFGLISRLPNQAMEWLGGRGLNGEKMGDPGHIAGATTLATGYFGEKAASQIQNMSSSLGRAGADTGKLLADGRTSAGNKATQAGTTDGELGRPKDSKMIGNEKYESAYKVGKEKHDKEEQKHHALLGAITGAGNAGGQGGGTPPPAGTVGPGGGAPP